MAIDPTNDFNDLGLISLKAQNRQMKLALNGDSIVNPFSDMLDRQGVTLEGRARKEREESDHFLEAMALIDERRLEVQREFDRLDHASLQALHENEEQLRESREEMRKVQERAYQIHLPDGTLARVYLDGEKVRMESGAELSRDIVKAEDLGDGHPTWADYSRRRSSIDDLNAEHEAILKYRQELHETQEKAASGSVTADELNSYEARIEKLTPDSIRVHTRQDSPVAPPSRRTDENDPSSGGILAKPFTKAASGAVSNAVLSEQDFDELTRQTPIASVPAPK